MNKKISIIIPVKNEENYIQECLDSIINFDYPKELLEIIFVDGMSTDKTIDIINNYKDQHQYINIFENKEEIVPISMNIGIEKSKGEYICRLDAHAKYPSNYLSVLLSYSQKLNADNVGTACITDIKSNSYTAKAIKFVMSDKFGVGNSLFRTGIKEVKEVDTVPFGFYKKNVFKKNGLYDERLIRVQDLEFNKRLKNKGGKIYLIPNIKCTYFPRETFSSFFKNRFQTGKWVILAAYLTDDLKSVSIRHLIPLLFSIIIVLSFLGALFSTYSLYLLYIILFIYSSILLLRSFLLTKNIVLSFYQLIAYFILHFSYGLGSITAITMILTKQIKRN